MVPTDIGHQSGHHFLIVGQHLLPAFFLLVDSVSDVLNHLGYYTKTMDMGMVGGRCVVGQPMKVVPSEQLSCMWHQSAPRQRIGDGESNKGRVLSGIPSGFVGEPNGGKQGFHGSGVIGVRGQQPSTVRGLGGGGGAIGHFKSVLVP